MEPGPAINYAYWMEPRQNLPSELPIFGYSYSVIVAILINIYLFSLAAIAQGLAPGNF